MHGWVGFLQTERTPTEDPARPGERPAGRESTARGTRRPKGAARLGRDEVLCGAVGRDSKGQSRGRCRRREHRSDRV